MNARIWHNGNGKTKGFTLVEVIVTLVISAIVIGAVATYLIYGSNFLAKTETTAEDKTLAVESADFVRNRLLYAKSITIIRSTKPPEGTSNAEILFIGDADGTKITNSGQLYYKRVDDSAVNAFGKAMYQSNSLAMSYRAIVKTDSETGKTTKVFEITMSTIRNGKKVYDYTKTFTLYEASLDAQPSEDMSITSWSNDEEFDTSMATYYIMINPSTKGYATNGLVAHFDAIDNDYYDGANGQALHNPNLTGKWEDISGNGNDMTLTFTNVSNSNPTPIRDQSIYFDGEGDYGRTTNKLDLSPYDAITIEVCFRETDPTKDCMLFETTTTWNGNLGAIGEYINSDGYKYVPNRVHTVGRQGGGEASSQKGARNFVWASDPTRFTTHSLVFSKIADPAGRLVFIDGMVVSYNNDGVDFTNSTATTAGGSFANDYLFVASRNGGNNYKGEIASVRIYGRKLTNDEVAQNSLEDRARFGF